MCRHRRVLDEVQKVVEGQSLAGRDMGVDHGTIHIVRVALFRSRQASPMISQRMHGPRGSTCLPMRKPFRATQRLANEIERRVTACKGLQNID